ncbi:MAG: hypothetical protein KME15_27715 [Drouetiella hepatica Uher 2000/2452]|uniref:Uncharacterized protein n=1 Tax=Drouetiella hepatica Uher 2000/2452 TaxID=904376 RepID=A0A951UQ92_9CYAN|nr:hypothetical protein [Drouetiella hepatica Uher 2000/2452]
MTVSSSFWAKNVSLPYPSNDIACILLLTIYQYGAGFLGVLQIFNSKTDELITTLWMDKDILPYLAGSMDSRDSEDLGRVILGHYNVQKASDLINPEKRQKTEVIRG